MEWALSPYVELLPLSRVGRALAGSGSREGGGAVAVMILLYGGDGFLGRHVSERAHQLGLPFTVVSNCAGRGFLDSHARSGQVMSVSDFHGKAGQSLIASAEAMVYLASKTVPSNDEFSGTSELPLNVEPAWRTINHVVALNPSATVVYLSSGGAIYGHTTAESVTEADPPAPVSSYGLGKVLCEEVVWYLQRRYGSVTRILRPSNPIGRWQKRLDHGLVGVAVRKFLNDEPVTVYGDGATVRDYISAEDVANAILAAARTPTGVSGVWNVGSGEGRSILQILEMVSRAVGRPMQVEHGPARNVDVRHIVLDSTAFRREFDWRPTTPIEVAVENIVRHQLRTIEAAPAI